MMHDEEGGGAVPPEKKMKKEEAKGGGPGPLVAAQRLSRTGVTYYLPAIQQNRPSLLQFSGKIELSDWLFRQRQK
jgi:hypothetical protein